MVAALTTASDPDLRAGVEGWVGSSLGAMPEWLRLGVLTESIGLELWSRVRPGRDDHALLHTFESSSLWPVRQYVRLLRSLVIFAEQELAGVAERQPA